MANKNRHSTSKHRPKVKREREVRSITVPLRFKVSIEKKDLEPHRNLMDELQDPPKPSP